MGSSSAEILAQARAEAQARRRAALDARRAAAAAAEATVGADSDAFWERREVALQAGQRGKKLAQLIVHDLKNHLSVVKTNVEYALDDVSEGSAGREAVVRAAAAIEEAFRLTAELIAVEQVDELRPVCRAQALSPLLQAVAAGLSPSARARGVALSVEAGDGLSALADPRLLGRVVHHLAEEAIGRPATTTVRIAASREGAKVRVSIEDDGEAAASHSPDAAAGFDFCRAAVEAHGGAMSLGPRAPRGTRAVLEISAVAASTARAA